MSKNKERGGCGGIVGLFWLFMIIRGCISGEYDRSSTPDFDDDSDENVKFRNKIFEKQKQIHGVRKKSDAVFKPKFLGVVAEGNFSGEYLDFVQRRQKNS